jgi:hypothetical protein
MADPVQIARGVMGGARAAAPKNFAQEYDDLLKIFMGTKSESQRELAREAAQKLYNESLQNFKMTVPGGKGTPARVFDISPNAPNLVVKMPSGAIIEIPRGANIPQGAQVLNKSADELRAIIPDEIRPLPPQRTTSVPTAGARPSDAAPAAPAPSTAPWGSRPAPPGREPDLTLPLATAGLASTGALLGSQRSDIYAGGREKPTIPLDDVQVQYGDMGRAPPFGGEYNDVFNAPYTPPTKQGGDYNDVFNVPYTPPPSQYGSVGRAGGLPVMARTEGGRGEGAEVRPIIDPSILMLARQRLMPYSMQREEGAAPAAGGSGSPARGGSGSTTTAASSTSAPAAQSSGMFSGLFKDPYEGQTSRQLYEAYQKRQMSGDDDPAMYARAARRELEERGRARGGSAEGSKHGKDAAVMKALEIIHHMLSNR